MKKKIFVTLSSDVLANVDRDAGSRASRSAFIESVLRDYVKTNVREAIHARDLELINAHVDYLTRESSDLDQYQAPIKFSSKD
jgi:metal-responsive CopG/Arc/MetJ family transcriptional regulator